MTINFHLALSVLCTIVVIYFTFTYVINPMRDYFYSFCVQLYFKEIEERDKKKKKNYVSPCLLFPETLDFFLFICVPIWDCFPSVWRTSFSISCFEGLLAVNPLNFCLSENIFLYFALIFEECIISLALGFKFEEFFLSFSILNILFHCGLAGLCCF